MFSCALWVTLESPVTVCVFLGVPYTQREIIPCQLGSLIFIFSFVSCFIFILLVCNSCFLFWPKQCLWLNVCGGGGWQGCTRVCVCACVGGELMKIEEEKSCNKCVCPGSVFHVCFFWNHENFEFFPWKYLFFFHIKQCFILFNYSLKILHWNWHSEYLHVFLKEYIMACNSRIWIIQFGWQVGGREKELYYVCKIHIPAQAMLFLVWPQ